MSDTTAPTVAITSTETSPTSANPIPLTITFSEAVTGFAVGDITVVGCTLANFATADNTVFTVNATPTARSITIDVAEGVCADAAGNTNTAATQFAIVWEYAEYVKDLFTTAIISYLPLWESSGVTADDYAGTKDGAYNGSGVTLGEVGIGDGRTCVKLDGSAGRVNWYSAGLAGAFNGAEGTVAIWAKVADAGVWTDGTIRYIFRVAATSGTNFVRTLRSSTNNRLDNVYMAATTQEQRFIDGLSETGWMHIAITWSKSNDRVRVFYNGVQQGATMTVLGEWSGALNSDITLLGSASWGSAGNCWSGWLAHALLLNREATPTEVANIATLPFDDPSATPGDSTITTYYLEDGGDINATCSLMKAGDILELAAGGTHSIGPLEVGAGGGFSTLPSGIAFTHTKVYGNGATVSGGEYACYLAGKSYIDIQDVNFGAAQIWSMVCTNSSNITFTDCDFYNPATSSAYDVCRFDNCTNFTLTRCDAHSTTDQDFSRAHDGFELWGPCSHFVFTDCTAYDIKNGATAQEGHGFEIYGQLAGQIVDDVLFDGCEAYNCQVGFSVEGGPLSLSHTNIICDGTSSHDNAFYGYEGIDGSTLYRQNLDGTDNTGNGSAETFGNVTDL